MAVLAPSQSKLNSNALSRGCCFAVVIVAVVDLRLSLGLDINIS